MDFPPIGSSPTVLQFIPISTQSFVTLALILGFSLFLQVFSFYIYTTFTQTFFWKLILNRLLPHA